MSAVGNFQAYIEKLSRQLAEEGSNQQLATLEEDRAGGEYSRAGYENLEEPSGDPELDGLV